MVGGLVGIGSLFSGIGGLELGLELAGLGPVVWQVEKDPYCRKILAKHWPQVERFDDVKAVGAATLAPVELICGGFPCQDVSSAGKSAGLTGSRSGLWGEFARIVGELRPRWAVVENVTSGASRWLDPVVRDLAELGYEALPLPLSAEAVGAPHLRRRHFIVARLADADGVRQPQLQRGHQERGGRVGDGGCETEWHVEHAFRCGRAPLPASDTDRHWIVEPPVGGDVDGVSGRLDKGGLNGDEKSGLGEMLRYVHQAHVSQALEWATRRLGRVSAETFLLTFMREYEAGGRIPRELLESPQTSDGLLRSMRGQRATNGASLRREPREQLSREHTDALCQLSQLVASRGETPWSNPLWEGAVTRVAHGVPGRMDRLRALGNAVVPQCAEVAGWVIRELELA